MVFYKCPRCNYSTSKKTYMKMHIGRKTQCQLLNKDIDIHTLDINSLKINDDETLETPETLKTPETPEDTEDLSDDLVCKNCSKEFTRLDARKRHQKICTGILDAEDNKDNKDSKDSKNNKDEQVVYMNDYKEPYLDNIKDIAANTMDQLINNIIKIYEVRAVVIEQIYYNNKVPSNHSIMYKNDKEIEVYEVMKKKYTIHVFDKILDELYNNTEFWIEHGLNEKILDDPENSRYREYKRVYNKKVQTIEPIEILDQKTMIKLKLKSNLDIPRQTRKFKKIEPAPLDIPTFDELNELERANLRYKERLQKELEEKIKQEEKEDKEHDMLVDQKKKSRKKKV